MRQCVRLRPWARIPTSQARHAVTYGSNTVGEMTNAPASGEGLSLSTDSTTIPNKQMNLYKSLLNSLQNLILQSLAFIDWKRDIWKFWPQCFSVKIEASEI